MERKYLVVPGYIHSKNDGDRHFIGASQLMRLYGVKPQQCSVVTEDGSTYGRYKDMIVLRPRYDGNYTLPDKTETASGAVGKKLDGDK